MGISNVSRWDDIALGYDPPCNAYWEQTNDVLQGFPDQELSTFDDSKPLLCRATL